MPTPAPRRVLAVVSALALGFAGTLAVTPAFAAEEPVEQQVSTSAFGPITPIDNTAPTYTLTQSYNPKQGGRTDVTVVFSEPIHPKSLGQGWYGSGDTFTKAYYSSKPQSATFADRVGNQVVVSFTVDATAPSVSVSQAYQAKEGGRTAVTLTFSEPITGLGQGWNGSGTTWTKIYYTSKTHTVSFTDLVGYPGQVTFTVDATAPTAVVTQAYQAKEGGRMAVTLTLSEPVTGLGQGWNGSGLVFTKIFYSSKQHTVTFVDGIGYPGQVTFTVDPIVAPTAH
jgi:uncharacterized lipoprotein NlpE involved in copper resistance